MLNINFENVGGHLKKKERSGSSYLGYGIDGCSSLCRRVATDRPYIIASRG